jgi:hypothetical protein
MTKSNKPQIKEFNCETGKEIVRDANADEIAQMKLDAATDQANKAAAEAKTAQRQAILDKLGLTAAEAQLLIG